MKKRNLLILSFLIIIFLLILYLVIFKNQNVIDEKVYELISKFHSTKATTIFKIFTFLGSTIMVTSICLISILFLRNYYKIICLNTISIVLINQLLKFIVRRNRPIGINLIEETGFSFPSGHSMVSIGLYGTIIYLICTSKLKKSLKITLSIIISFLILMIGISRIYLGVHFTTDVLGGFILGIICLIILFDTLKIDTKLRKEI